MTNTTTPTTTPLDSDNNLNNDNNEAIESNTDSMSDFYKLRDSLLIGTAIITLVSFLLVWYFYSLTVGLSYLLGACFSLMYVNMLAREVERVGTFKRRIGSTRLALFVGLIIVATQWQQLQVIPVFLGFMTYKASILFYVLPSSILPSQDKTKKG